MIGFIVENKWQLLAGAEILAWLSTFFFFFARYWWNSVLWEKLSLVLLVLTGVLPHLTLAAIDWWQAGEAGLFPLVVGALLAYSLTRGKKDMEAVDRWIKAKVDRWKGIEDQEY